MTDPTREALVRALNELRWLHGNADNMLYGDDDAPIEQVAMSEWDDALTAADVALGMYLSEGAA